MHDDERKGVVNRNCRVHGYSNFYIAGSSVFPTAGANFPTITITALAIRLATHVLAELKQSSSMPIGSTINDVPATSAIKPVRSLGKGASGR
jgi:choline dehydrogenase-like flavoprotein